MSVNYTVLKSSIIYSTVWGLPSDWRIVWVTLLAMRNKDGEIYSSIPGLAHTARVSPEQTKKAIECFLSPDPESTTPEHEGRRIEAIVGGWRLLNHEKVKQEAINANRAAYMTTYMRDKRAKVKGKSPYSSPMPKKAGEEFAEKAPVYTTSKLDAQPSAKDPARLPEGVRSMVEENRNGARSIGQIIRQKPGVCS